MSFDGGSNIIRLADFQKRRQAVGLRLVSAGEPCAGKEKDTVFFVTGGRFDCSVNNVTGTLRTGDFVRIADGASFAFRDTGPLAGTLVSHRFTTGIPSGFLREIGLALPPFAQSFPPRDSADFAQLMQIARRWGVIFDSETAA